MLVDGVASEGSVEDKGYRSKVPATRLNLDLLVSSEGLKDEWDEWMLRWNGERRGNGGLEVGRVSSGQIECGSVALSASKVIQGQTPIPNV